MKRAAVVVLMFAVLASCLPAFPAFAAVDGGAAAQKQAGQNRKTGAVKQKKDRLSKRNKARIEVDRMKAERAAIIEKGR